MKTAKYILLAAITIFFSACSDESAIEGLIPAKPKSIVLNSEVLKNAGYKQISFSIENDDFVIYAGHSIANNQFVVEIGFLQTGTNPIMSFSSFLPYNNIRFVPQGDVIDNSVTYSSSSLLTRGTVTAGPAYNYQGTNMAKFGNDYYLPFKVNSAAGSTETIGWMLIRLDENKIVFNKLAYVKNTTIKAGEE